MSHCLELLLLLLILLPLPLGLHPLQQQQFQCSSIRLREEQEAPHLQLLFLRQQTMAPTKDGESTTIFWCAAAPLSLRLCLALSLPPPPPPPLLRLSPLRPTPFPRLSTPAILAAARHRGLALDELFVPSCYVVVCVVRHPIGARG